MIEDKFENKNEEISDYMAQQNGNQQFRLMSVLIPKFRCQRYNNNRKHGFLSEKISVTDFIK